MRKNQQLERELRDSSSLKQKLIKCRTDKEKSKKAN